MFYLINSEQEVSDVIERRSFRAYASILYKSPRMKIILQNKRVRTRLLAYSLYLPKRIQVAYKSFKNQSEKQINEAKSQIEVTKRKLTEVQAQSRFVGAVLFLSAYFENFENEDIFLRSYMYCGKGAEFNYLGLSLADIISLLL